jgi:hypothetical protein
VCTNADPARIRAQFPPNTVFIHTADGPARTRFDEGLYTITVPLQKFPYDAFTSAFSILSRLNADIPLDMVVVLPFGPPSYFTALQMRDAWKDTWDTGNWVPLDTNVWAPYIIMKK